MEAFDLEVIAFVFATEFVKMHQKHLQLQPRSGRVDFEIPFLKMNAARRKKLCNQVLDKISSEALGTQVKFSETFKAVPLKDFPLQDFLDARLPKVLEGKVNRVFPELTAAEIVGVLPLDLKDYKKAKKAKRSVTLRKSHRNIESYK